MSQKPRILCVCTWGHSRSVALTRLLHEKGYEAVACGWHPNRQILPQLCVFFDKICVLETSFRQHIPKEEQSKVVDFHVGPDIWSNPYRKDLKTKLEELYKKNSYLL